METDSPVIPTQSNHGIFASVEEYVSFMGGNKIIKKILIANNGIAAVKGIRSMRKWCNEVFGKSDEIKFVVMATPEDIQANAEYVRLADELVKVPGESNYNNYSNVKLIVDIAEQFCCDAVWPGWGHASENPELPFSLSQTKRQIAFIGPDSVPMEALGDKISSTILAQAAGVPCIPWSGSEVHYDITKSGLPIPEDIYLKCCITSESEALKCANKIGYPIMIKASEGGGGKGIRKVANDIELKLGFSQVKNEVPGSPIFLMKLSSESRHLEVQVVADKHGNALALYSRDCSVQRRHQKIIEEGPVTVAPKHVIDKMEAAAVTLARSVNYSGAGTVEYLYEPATEHVYFLELNPRLQVEHPVTEWITLTNIPSIQLQIAMGISLNRIPDIRRFFGVQLKDLYTVEPQIDVNDAARRQPPVGHVIACRVTAENPESGFQPTCGSVVELNFRTNPNVWGYFSIRSQGAIHAFSDSQFGHIFTKGETREEARKTMLSTLSELAIRGEIRTTAEYLQSLLKFDDYVNNNYTTSWLDNLISKKIKLEKPDTLLVVTCGAVHTLHRMVSERAKNWILAVERGQVPSFDNVDVHYSIELIYENIKYQVDGVRSGPNKYTLALNGSTIEAELSELRDSGLLIVVDNGSHVSYASEEPSGLKLTLDGKVCMFTKEFDPSQLRSTLSGKFMKYLVENGAHVKPNTPVAELEVMKMIVTVYAPLPGRVNHCLVDGTGVNQGDIIAIIDLDDKSQVKRSLPFEGQFPPAAKVNARLPPNRVVSSALETVQNLLAGYDYPAFIFNDKLSETMLSLRKLGDRNVIIHEMIEKLSVLRKFLPVSLVREVNNLLQKRKIEYDEYCCKDDNDHTQDVYNEDLVKEITSIFKNFESGLEGAKKEEFLIAAKPVFELLELFNNGYKQHAFSTLAKLLEEYIQTEKIFDTTGGKRREAVWFELRQKHSENLNKTYQIGLSHFRLSSKNKVIRSLLEIIEELDMVKESTPLLDELASFVAPEFSDVAVAAKHILTSSRLPSKQRMKDEMEGYFKDGLEAVDNQQKLACLKELIVKSNYSFDILLEFFSDPDERIANLAAEVYIRKAYCTFDIDISRVTSQPKFKTVEFSFMNTEKSTSGSLKSDGIVGSISMDCLSSLSETEDNIGFGVLAIFDSVSDIDAHLPDVMKIFENNDDADNTNVLKILLRAHGPTPNDVELLPSLTNLLKKHSESLQYNEIKRVTVVVEVQDKLPFYFTFRQRFNYDEDPMYRHIEPTLAFQLFLKKLSNYNITPYPCKDPSVHVFYGQKKKELGLNRYDFLNKRFFVRTLVLQGDIFTEENPEELQISELERYVVASINALEIAMADKNYPTSYANHIFVNFLPEVVVKADMVGEIIERFQKVYGKRLWKLRVSEVEVRFTAKFSRTSQPQTFRFIALDDTGYNLTLDVYREEKDQTTGRTVYKTVVGEKKPLEGLDVNIPHPILQAVDQKRVLAHNNDTSYVYDFPYLFERVVRSMWKEHNDLTKEDIPSTFISLTEYILDTTGKFLIENPVKNAIGKNTCGMVVWKVTLFTPEAKDGRDMILIANDITYQSGSFGVIEDEVFQLASEMARKLKIPRFYIAANSGARIGLADEVRELFKIEWNEPNDSTKGFKYLYLTPNDYEKLQKTNSVNAVEIEVNGEKRWKIIDIIGKENGIGVENLRGSGMIAGETSRAYEEVFTMNYIAARSVGIGAYVNRLGQRIIQNRKAPILLTGAGALNKVLSREVYTSNLQLGGIQIMNPNGVTHLIAKDDYLAIKDALKWLSYVPKSVGSALPILKTLDDPERQIQYLPVEGSHYDFREMLVGKTVEGENGESTWLSGFFDKNSFFETLTGWAKNIIVARARLGGIPMGVIAVDTKTYEQIIPADPADSNSRERVVQKSGQVWYPDSAFKTAQAINDFNKGEQLPLMIFANWRGFSGGQRDMFDEILKFGSYIVDALTNYKQPVFVYIPPNGELRGGAWVVVDPMINNDVMEMFADDKSKGGILEASGIVEIKYRKQEIVATIQRLDAEYINLAKELGRSDISLKEKDEIKVKMGKRVEKLIPIYTQVAECFADLHDTPGRMKAKGVITEIISWKTARTYFYWRLKRKILEFNLLKELSECVDAQSNKLSIKREILRQKVINNEQVWTNDREFLSWIEDNKETVTQAIATLRGEKVKQDILSLCSSGNLGSVCDGLLSFLENNSDAVGESLKEKLRKLL
ncbi:predicted protein [Naegleria gruberi]|uniref:Predicted protein n=1 Tax=Naegleria gruberi TaxID=5762 RepID=D2W323_NAEGR|nr:uncharacterized protein NAEGRDRAFT_59984 [Naegleria gruberi]EFC36537.1 predicted protein [Naegleria gruberi]|eukprot:XP_002669281.1 predicted protein [Naegleria gruberi strain NEG-M]